ncbi:unnamed protein product [Musa hybrid cultivar]
MAFSAPIGTGRLASFIGVECRSDGDCTWFDAIPRARRDLRCRFSVAGWSVGQSPTIPPDSVRREIAKPPLFLLGDFGRS